VVKKKLEAGGLAQTIRESANQIFLAGLGAFAKAQEEGTRVFDSLVVEGTTVFDGLVKEVGAAQRRAVNAADETMTEMKNAASTTWNRLERMFEGRVVDVLHGLNVATKSDLDHLANRIARLVAVEKKPAKRKSPVKGRSRLPARTSRGRRAK